MVVRRAEACDVVAGHHDVRSQSVSERQRQAAQLRLRDAPAVAQLYCRLLQVASLESGSNKECGDPEAVRVECGVGQVVPPEHAREQDERQRADRVRVIVRVRV
eukprot:TRINITY_DN2675_c0_g2_i1.p1 TRINITY_DN2675_c0_g2~~TRINITY_DN2675_c0_g2_i1.p1  ORF type:complete len:104 (-),score=17.84 TRINITY_DN2675_c0_g2_i1:131-442(-)